MALLIAFCHLCITSPLFAQEQSLAPWEQATLTISNAQEPAELVQVPISETEASIIASPLIEQDPTLTTLDIQVPNEVQAQEPESIETTQDTNNTQESQQPSIATIINNAPADNTQENTSITNSDWAQLVVPEQYIVFDKIGRVQIETLQSVSTIGWPEDITYCSRIARENIQNLLAAWGQDISTFTIARGDAEVLIAQWVANRTIFALEQKDVSTTLQSLFDSNKNTIYDLYISHVIGENHIGHRVTVVLGTDNNFYVLDPIWWNKSTSGQTLSDYLSYFNTNAQFYISNIWYNPILKEKEIWLNANDIGRCQGYPDLRQRQLPVARTDRVLVGIHRRLTST